MASPYDLVARVQTRRANPWLSVRYDGCGANAVTPDGPYGTALRYLIERVAVSVLLVETAERLVSSHPRTGPFFFARRHCMGRPMDAKAGVITFDCGMRGIWWTQEVAYG